MFIVKKPLMGLVLYWLKGSLEALPDKAPLLLLNIFGYVAQLEAYIHSTRAKGSNPDACCQS